MRFHVVLWLASALFLGGVYWGHEYRATPPQSVSPARDPATLPMSDTALRDASLEIVNRFLGDPFGLHASGFRRVSAQDGHYLVLLTVRSSTSYRDSRGTTYACCLSMEPAGDGKPPRAEGFATLLGYQRLGAITNAEVLRNPDVQRILQLQRGHVRANLWSESVPP